MNTEQLASLSMLLSASNSSPSLTLNPSSLNIQHLLEQKLIAHQQQQLQIQTQKLLALASLLPLSKKLKVDDSFSTSQPSLTAPLFPQFLAPSINKSMISSFSTFSQPNPTFLNLTHTPKPLLQPIHTPPTLSQDSDSGKNSPQISSENVRMPIIFRPKPIRRDMPEGDFQQKSSIIFEDNGLSQEEAPRPVKKAKENKEVVKKEKKVKVKSIEKEEVRLIDEMRQHEANETRKLNRLQLMRQTQEEIVEEARKNAAENCMQNYLRVSEDGATIKIGEDHQAVIPKLENTRSVRREVKPVWNPEAQCDLEKYFKELDSMLGEGVIEAKALKLLTRKEFDVEESLRMVKKKRNYYKEFFKAPKETQATDC